MRLSFRQGVVSHQPGGFLQLVGGGDYVNILAGNRPVVVTVAHKNTDYVWSEDDSIPGSLVASNPWIGPFDSGTRYWLFWDFDPITFQRAFGYTTLAPIAQPIAPGDNYAEIINVVPGGSPNGNFVVSGHYVINSGRAFEVLGG